jgi:hypothetical protein
MSSGKGYVRRRQLRRVGLVSVVFVVLVSAITASVATVDARPASAFACHQTPYLSQGVLVTELHVEGTVDCHTASLDGDRLILAVRQGSASISGWPRCSARLEHFHTFAGCEMLVHPAVKFSLVWRLLELP